MGNFLLDRIEPLKHYFINVDPFDRKQRNNTGGMRQALAHLQNGGLHGHLPRRGVSTCTRLHGCKDKPWPPSILRFIRKAAVPVIPLYIHARNSRLFHLAGKIHPLLRTALLPNELLNKHDRDDPATDRFADRFPQNRRTFALKHTVVSCGRTSNT